ncbi:MAG: carboxypeptidase regulatory-like domain-containing protein [Bryobacterales bacterium]|nr:carboxypeptidase regulatory-like domain-containing protein [Bryobacterales bacterium]
MTGGWLVRSRCLALCLLGCAAAVCPQNTGSISGVVTEARTGKPVPNAEVLVSPARGGLIRIRTDQDGRYIAQRLPAGEFRVSTMVHAPVNASRSVTLAPGESVTSADLAVEPASAITGYVSDAQGEPLPNVRVLLIGREYYLGALRYGLRDIATTDDRGFYRLQRVAPGVGYLVLAKPVPAFWKTVSDAPADPDLRAPTAAPTYFPGADRPEGAQVLTLAAGEEREGVDIRLAASPSYCLEGMLESDAGPAALRFELFEVEPARGSFRGGGVITTEPGGLTGPGGRIRLCGLTRGAYRVESWEPNASVAFGRASVTITDRDVTGFTVQAVPKMALPVEVVLPDAEEGAGPAGRMTVSLGALFRASRPGEETRASVTIPGSGQFPGLYLDDYAILVGRLSGALYVKDIEYGGASVLHRPLRLGTAIGNAPLRVILGSDGGTIQVRVRDRDGNPAPDAHVVILPAQSLPEAELADVLVTGRANQHGHYRSRTLAPGKYLAFVPDRAPDHTPEGMAAVLARRSGAKEVELESRGKAVVDWTP